MEKKIDLNDNGIILNSFDRKYLLKFDKQFSNPDINNFKIDGNIINELSEKFSWTVKYGFSLDNINFSEFVYIWDFSIPIMLKMVDLYIGIEITASNLSDIRDNTPNKLKLTHNNVDSSENYYKINKITYSNSELEFETKIIQNLIYEFPKFNLYDNKEISIRRWLDQCISISEMYGHLCIYFKTESIDRVDTLVNNRNRDVVLIKKLKILFPNNEIPQDRNIYTDWDIPLQDDIIIHIVDERFKDLFGDKSIPASKDYLYLPLLNKLWQVQTVQPKNGFMGKIGWWECYLAQYEDDDSINIPESMINIGGGDFNEDYNNDYDNESSNLFNELSKLKEDTTYANDIIWKDTIDEKKEVTENFSNVLVDSTHFISIKESNYMRSEYDKRLEIVSIQPSENTTYKINAYDCTKVQKNVIAMNYDLNEYVSKNKNSLNINDNFGINFNFVNLKRNNSVILNISNEYKNEILNLSIYKTQLSINYNSNIYLINYEFELNKIYNIDFNFDIINKQLIIKVLQHDGYNFIEIFSDIIYIELLNLLIEQKLSETKLFGGKWLLGYYKLIINNKTILADYNKPILIMNNTKR